MMKKINYIPLFLPLMFGLSLTVQAADSSSVYSNANVIVSEDDGSQIDSPYHPLFPEESINPNNPDFPKTDGPLSINYASSLSFSHQTAVGKDMFYNSQLDKVNVSGKSDEVPNFIQVSDHRGTNAGWKLEVKQSEPFKNGSHALEGTEIHLKNPALSSVSGDKEISPFIKKELVLTPNSGYTTLLEAKENQGMGTWLIRFGTDSKEAPESVQLFVPGNTKKVKGHYQTTLSWLLKDAPTE